MPSQPPLLPPGRRRPHRTTLPDTDTRLADPLPTFVAPLAPPTISASTTGSAPPLLAIPSRLQQALLRCPLLLRADTGKHSKRTTVSRTTASPVIEHFGRLLLSLTICSADTPLPPPTRTTTANPNPLHHREKVHKPSSPTAPPS
uniref:Uncharacterized protein n=1 Tax=Oryza punctata TaxID=4537 RepID=A0A0E0L9J0_ORYPU